MLVGFCEWTQTAVGVNYANFFSLAFGFGVYVHIALFTRPQADRHLQRPNVPASIASTNSTSIDISQWGPPSAAYPMSGCNIPQFFTPQNLVIDITLCGDWAGIGPVYNATCGNSGPTGLCVSVFFLRIMDLMTDITVQYPDNVVGPGSPKFDEAYFEISYVRAYTTPNPTPTGTTATSNVADATSTTISESGGMGGPTVVVTSSPGATGGSTGMFVGLTPAMVWGIVGVAVGLDLILSRI